MNRLAQEKSPYLLQHAENPVDWHPWGEEAFEAARREDKPIFLSIGYATCHWCHVMAHESFENREAAGLLNETFICVKVDREERPDIDEIYMTVCQMLTRSGGWPLTIVMTPDKKPFFAATYIPLESRFGRQGLLELIPRLADFWKNRRADTLASAEKIVGILSEPEEGSDGDLAADILNRVFEESAESFDDLYGGFLPAPKFPSPHRLIFLIRQNPEEARPMVEKTITAMRLGGIWDHVGFGIHRYSTDREWLVPHFEKMLYDQAMVVLACTEAYEAYGDVLYRRMAEEVCSYVLRDMQDDCGGFYSAEDADSEGVEGRFYVWSADELRQLLAPDEYEMAVQVFHVLSNGNFKDESTGQKTGENILHLKLFPKDESAVEMVRRKLFEVRQSRIHPLKDTKVLTDWNGLMIAALAKAGRCFGSETYVGAARHAAEFLWDVMQDSGRLQHRWKEGDAAVPGQLPDYSFFIFGLLELYEATFDAEWLQKALRLNQTVLNHFQDQHGGGFFLVADDAEKLIVRPKSMHDGALPSGCSVQLMNLVRLARLTARTEYEGVADRTLRSFSATLNRVPSAFTAALQAVQFVQNDACEVVIAGEFAASQRLIDAVYASYVPYKTVLFKTAELEDRIPFLKEMHSSEDNPQVYICRNFACEKPLTDPSAVRLALQR